MPIGTPMITAPAVTYKLQMIIGKIPNSSLLGRHISPVMNFTNPISLIAGMPLANKKIHMRATASTEAQAATKNTPCMNFSVHAFDFILISSSFYLILPNSSVTRRALLSDLIPCKYVSEVDGFYLIRCHLFCRVRFVYDHCDTVCRNDCSFQFLFFFVFQLS